MKRQLTAVIFSSDPDGEAEIRQSLRTDQRIRVVAVSAQMEQAYAEVVHWRPSAAIIMLSENPETGWMLCRQINAVCPDTVIICASRDYSPDTILESLRAGSREFLRLPVIAEELMTVLNRIAEFSAASSQSPKKSGRVISVFSNKGGCGTSFIAANLAVSLGAPTVLVDLNLQSASLDLFFGVKARYSIVDLVENRTRMDDQLLSNYLISHSPNLSVLAAPQDIEEADRFHHEHLIEALDILRARFDYVVLDLPHTFEPLTISALDQSEDILLVLTLDILASRAAQRAVTLFYRLGYAREKIRLVLNRWSKQSDLELRHVERFLGERIACFISEDFRAAVNSINLGRPLAEAAAANPIAVELKHLASLCGGKADQAPAMTRKNMLASLFRRQTSALDAENPSPSVVDRREQPKSGHALFGRDFPVRP